MGRLGKGIISLIIRETPEELPSRVSPGYKVQVYVEYPPGRQSLVKQLMTLYRNRHYLGHTQALPVLLWTAETVWTTTLLT